MKIKQANFISGHPVQGPFPPNHYGEFALVGRSNVGKSSLLNRLTERKNLAFASKRPGTTRQINFFEVSFQEPQPNCWMVDLPGFGFGKFSFKERKAVAQAVVNYIVQREPLKLICLLNDSKRDPEDDEFAIRDLCLQAGIPLLVVITKIDRLNQKERHSRLQSLCKAYDLEKSDFLVTGTNTSADEFWQRVCPLLAE